MMERVIPATTTRVSASTAPHVNEGVRQTTRVEVASHTAAGPEAVAARLAALEHEWDIDRVVGFGVGALVLSGLALHGLGRRRGLGLSAAAAASLAAHAAHGWSPLLGALRRLGFRTAQEIQDERQALKALRGDFRALAPGPVTRQSLDQALAIVRH